ncbi:MAG TPA: hypothetical protein VLL52_10720 [Anaerolineae bacterium]|nr:hypothetical protein [Anaerolineae bacterium]
MNLKLALNDIEKQPPLSVSRAERHTYYEEQLARVRAKGWSGDWPYRLAERQNSERYSAELEAFEVEIYQAINQVAWVEFRTAYSDASPIPVKLEALLLGDLDSALNAAGELWASLCHQHAYLSSAALPAYPFLRLALEYGPIVLQIEILDIFRGFATVELKEFGIDKVAWHEALASRMRADIELFKKMLLVEDDDGLVRYFAEEILKKLA